MWPPRSLSHISGTSNRRAFHMNDVRFGNHIWRYGTLHGWPWNSFGTRCSCSETFAGKCNSSTKNRTFYNTERKNGMSQGRRKLPNQFRRAGRFPFRPYVVGWFMFPLQQEDPSCRAAARNKVLKDWPARVVGGGVSHKIWHNE